MEKSKNKPPKVWKQIAFSKKLKKQMPSLTHFNPYNNHYELEVQKIVYL